MLWCNLKAHISPITKGIRAFTNKSTPYVPVDLKFLTMPCLFIYGESCGESSFLSCFGKVVSISMREIYYSDYFVSFQSA